MASWASLLLHLTMAGGMIGFAGIVVYIVLTTGTGEPDPLFANVAYAAAGLTVLVAMAALPVARAVRRRYAPRGEPATEGDEGLLTRRCQQLLRSDLYACTVLEIPAGLGLIALLTAGIGGLVRQNALWWLAALPAAGTVVYYLRTVRSEAWFRAQATGRSAEAETFEIPAER
jgi:hypothetical protein